MEILGNIRDKKSIINKIKEIKHRYSTRVEKESEWIRWIKNLYDNGIITSEEYFKLKTWNIDW